MIGNQLPAGGTSDQSRGNNTPFRILGRPNYQFWRNVDSWTQLQATLLAADICPDDYENMLKKPEAYARDECKDRMDKARDVQYQLLISVRENLIPFSRLLDKNIMIRNTDFLAWCKRKEINFATELQPRELDDIEFGEAEQSKVDSPADDNAVPMPEAEVPNIAPENVKLCVSQVPGKGLCIKAYTGETGRKRLGGDALFPQIDKRTQILTNLAWAGCKGVLVLDLCKSIYGKCNFETVEALRSRLNAIRNVLYNAGIPKTVLPTFSRKVAEREKKSGVRIAFKCALVLEGELNAGGERYDSLGKSIILEPHAKHIPYVEAQHGRVQPEIPEDL